MDSHNEGYDAGVIAGLKEALEMAGDNPWFADLVRAIRSRIEELEKGNANG